LTPAVLGERIHVVGNSNAGKTTLATRLSELLGLPLVELDAINWQPDWVGLNTTAPDEFEKRVGQATSGDRWVVAGSYHSFSQRVFWGRLETTRRDDRCTLAPDSFIRLTSAREVEQLVASIAASFTR